MCQSRESKNTRAARRRVSDGVDVLGRQPGKEFRTQRRHRGTFVELVPGERIVQRVVFDSDDPSFAGTMTMTWSLLEAGDGTHVEIRADDVPAGISPEDHASGLAASLNNLANYLAAPQAGE